MIGGEEWRLVFGDSSNGDGVVDEPCLLELCVGGKGCAVFGIGD